MTLLDQMMAVVTPYRSETERIEARKSATALALDCEWLSEVVRQHAAIEQALEQVRVSTHGSQRRHALQWLGALLNGHSLAEQAVLYPAVSFECRRAHAVAAYADESSLKIELAALQTMELPDSDFHDKLERLRADLVFHIHEEESHWYPALFHAVDRPMHALLSARFGAEFRRYMGADAD
ncbi:MAG: hemerythrin domain-containing protein [Vitreoscilla sp.]